MNRNQAMAVLSDKTLSSGFLHSITKAPPYYFLVATILAIGAFFRIIPLFFSTDTMFQYFPSEDGYLMLTIARNIALGNGMSTAEGTIPTNGTQPLATLLYALGFWLVGGDKAWGVFVALIIQLTFVLISLRVLYILYKSLLEETSVPPRVGWLAVCIWFAMPLSIRHTTNCLETGLYTLFIGLSSLCYIKTLKASDSTISATKFVGLGFLFGLTFLARIDAALLILAFCLVHFGVGILTHANPVVRTIQTFIMGGVSVVVGTPWLIYNYVNFGSIMPVSGTAQSGEKLAENLPEIPGNLAEYMILFGLIPNSYQRHPLVLIACVLVILLGATGYGILLYRSRGAARNMAWVGVFFTLFFLGWYGVYFGASHFVSRYLFPLSVFLTLGSVILGYFAFQRLRLQGNLYTAYAIPAIVIAGLLVFNGRDFIKNQNHMHWQVVEWTRENVPSSIWVGAIQTGTLGFFHDRTINLDGKVNPYAMQARLEGRIPHYVVDSEIQYLVDWVGITDWSELPPLDEQFEVVVEDSERDLGVLKRK